jgi:hypothetical protein
MKAKLRNLDLGLRNARTGAMECWDREVMESQIKDFELKRRNVWPIKRRK